MRQERTGLLGGWGKHREWGGGNHLATLALALDRGRIGELQFFNMC